MTTYANMDISSPDVDDTDYATTVDDATGKIDAHDHSAGHGVQIPTAGIADDAVTNAKIADGAVQADQIADDAVTTAKIADNAVTTAKILNDAVTTAKIADNAATYDKRSGYNEVISSSSDVFDTSSVTFVDITNLTVSITTKGGRVMLACVPDESTSGSYFEVSRTGGGAGANIQLFRAGVAIDETRMLTASAQARFPAGSVVFTDKPSAGTYTYKLQVQATGDVFQARYVKLLAYELT